MCALSLGLPDGDEIGAFLVDTFLPDGVLDEIRAAEARAEELGTALAEGLQSGFEMANARLDDDLPRRILDSLLSHPEVYFAGLIDGYRTGAEDMGDDLWALVTEKPAKLWELWQDDRLWDEFATAASDMVAMFTEPEKLKTLAEQIALVTLREFALMSRDNRPPEIARQVGRIIGQIGFEVVVAAAGRGALNALKGTRVYARVVAKVDDMAAKHRKYRKARRDRKLKKAEELERKRKSKRAPVSIKDRVDAFYRKMPKTLGRDAATRSELERIFHVLQDGDHSLPRGADFKPPTVVAFRAAAAELQVVTRMASAKGVVRVRLVKPSSKERTADMLLELADKSTRRAEVTAITRGKMFRKVGDVVKGLQPRITQFVPFVDITDMDLVKDIRKYAAAFLYTFSRAQLKAAIRRKLVRGQITPGSPGIVIVKAFGHSADGVPMLPRSDLKGLRAMALQSGVEQIYVMHNGKTYHVLPHRKDVLRYFPDSRMMPTAKTP
jgi:hypothetical protein